MPVIIEVRDYGKQNWRVWTPRKVDHIPDPRKFVEISNHWYGFEKYRIREEQDQNVTAKPRTVAARTATTKPVPRKRATTKRATTTTKATRSKSK